MNTCAILLILAVQIYADGIEGPTGKACFHLHLLDDAEKSYHVDKTQLKPKKTKAKPSRVLRKCKVCASFLLLL